MAAAASPTTTSSGATALAGTFNFFNDSVGIRLMHRAEMATVHTQTRTSLDHQP